MRRLALLLFASAALGSAQVNAVLKMLEPAKPGPLTEKQKFYEYLRTTVGILPIAGSAMSAGVSQAINSPEEWGQGAAGYGKRFADSFGFNAVRTSIGYLGSFPLHEDNRYFASNRATVGGRIVYALMSPVTARKNGRRTFSFSGTAGIVGATFVEQAWSPPSWRTGESMVSTMAVIYGITAGTNLVREFVPDLLNRRRK